MIKSSLICIAVAISVFTTGCASSSSGSVNPSLKKDEPKFFSKSGGSACLLGATIAGLACLGIKDDNKASACLIAATAGCAAGISTAGAAAAAGHQRKGHAQGKHKGKCFFHFHQSPFSIQVLSRYHKIPSNATPKRHAAGAAC